MAFLLAACAFDIFLAILLVLVLIILQVVILVIFRLMLLFLAARLFFARLAATPPHFASILALMLTTRPVEVVILSKVFVAILACFEARVKLAFTL